MSTSKTELLRGTLDLLILQTLSLGPNHGLGISRRIFPALHRLQEKGWLESRWGDSENNRKAKYYELTPAGKQQLKSETENWDRVALAIARALRATS